MNQPEERNRVRVVIPVFNGERYLGETLESILSQTYPIYEVVVVDDGSTDGTAAVIRGFGRKIKYLYQPNQGTAAAFNYGIEHTGGDFFAFLGADDLWSDDKTRIQMEAFRTHSGADIISGHVKQFFSPDVDAGVRKKIQFAKGLIPGQVIPAMLIKRGSFFKVGMFETQWQIGAELSWFLRAGDVGLQIFMLPDLVLLRRIHEGNKGILKRQYATQRAEILKAALDRRRKQQTASE